MIDVIEPLASRKYGDTADASTPTASTTNAVADTPTGGATATTPGALTARLLTATANASSAASSLNARGRAVTFYEDDEDEPLEEDQEFYEEDEDAEGLDPSAPLTNSNVDNSLKASILDYVLSEAASHQQMDLETSANLSAAPRPRRKYAFNPELPQDVPPHLSEYYERNVIAVLNRCDPSTWGRCLSCGSNPAPQEVVIEQPAPPPPQSEKRQPGKVYEVDAFWNYYNYKSDYRTSSSVENNGFQSEPWQNNLQQPSNFGFERMRCNSDGNASATDLDGGAGNSPPVEGMEEGEEVFTFDARLLSEAFLSSGRVDHTIQLMAYHPDYLEIFLRTHHFLMRGDGPLPYNFRNYIAIMAAARYRCSYLMELQKREFLYQGGDPNWLRGLDFAPPKLVALYTVNKVLGHRPWVLKKEDLQHLTKKAGWSLSELVQAMVLLAHFHALSSFIHGCGITPEVDFDNGHSFLLNARSPSPAITSSTSTSAEGAVEKGAGGVSPPQVSFAVGPPSIVTTTNSLATSTSGGVGGVAKKSILKKTDNLSTSPGKSSDCGSLNSTSTGINVPSSVHFHPYHHPHYHPAGGSQQSSPVLKGDALRNSQCGTPRVGSTVSEVDIIMATMKNLSETSPIEDPEERKKRFETVARSDLDQIEVAKENVKWAAGGSGVKGAMVAHKSMLPPDVGPFIAEPEFTYEDFAKRGQVSELHTFRIQDYSWEEHGFSLVNRLYAEVGQILDDKFKVAQNMTYYTIGGRANVDTTKFRTAVWNYIQCLYGIRHDDYDYGEVNQLLERPLKAFIKTVCCYPERITKQDYDNVMREFKHSEKVHVNLMIMEAKLQAELLYALRTVMKLMF